MNQDFKEFFKSLNARGVEFLVVGGVAYNFYAPPRATKDIDVRGTRVGAVAYGPTTPGSRSLSYRSRTSWPASLRPHATRISSTPRSSAPSPASSAPRNPSD